MQKIVNNTNKNPSSFENGFLHGASVHNQPLTRGKNLKKRRASAREMRVEALDWHILRNLIQCNAVSPSVAFVKQPIKMSVV